MRFCSIIPLLLVVFAGSVGSAAAQKAEGAIARVSEISYHFGSVPQGAKVTHEFDIRNEGTTDLLIQGITVSCGCTATSMSSKTIAPGKTEKLRMEFNTAGFSGSKTKTAELLTNDPQNPDIVFTLKGVVVPGVVLEPGRLEFGEITSTGDPSKRRKSFAVKIREGSDARISSARSFSRFLSVSPLGESSVDNVYSVELSPQAPRGEFRDRVVVEFSDDQIQPVNLPVTASIRGDISLEPAVVSFGVLKPGEALERRVKIENRSPSPVYLKLAPPSAAGLSASLIDVQAGRQSVLVVRVDPSQIDGDLKTSLEIETTHPVESKVSLNIIGVQAPR